MQPLDLLNLWPKINGQNWDSTEYSLEKTVVCCAFSRLAYWQIPKYELEDHKNLKLIPSSDYLEFIKKKKSKRIHQLLQLADFGEPIIIETQYVVLIALNIKGTLFISIRGTASFQEIFSDLKFFTIKIKGESNIRYHRGFYAAITESIESLSAELKKINAGDLRIYITGHSLGGAMAAILHSLMSGKKEFEKNKYAIALKDFRSHSCYAFGMPRFGNRQANEANSPFAFYREGDFVPGVPPKLFGYANSKHEFRINRKMIVPKAFVSNKNKVVWIYNKIRRVNVSNHFIDNYYKDLFYINKK